MKEEITDCWNDEATADNKCSVKCRYCNKFANSKYQCYEPCDDGEVPLKVIPAEHPQPQQSRLG